MHIEEPELDELDLLPPKQNFHLSRVTEQDLDLLCSCAALIVLKLDNSNYESDAFDGRIKHLNLQTISHELQIPCSLVSKQEMKLISHHKCRLLKPTPFEFICLFIEIID